MKYIKSFESVIGWSDRPSSIEPNINQKEIDRICKTLGINTLYIHTGSEGQKLISFKVGLRKSILTIRKFDGYYYMDDFANKCCYRIEDITELSYMVAAFYHLCFIYSDPRRISNYINIVKNIDKKVSDDIIWMYISYNNNYNKDDPFDVLKASFENENIQIGVDLLIRVLVIMNREMWRNNIDEEKIIEMIEYIPKDMLLSALSKIDNNSQIYDLLSEHIY
jgi:hypothetical protein